MSYKVLGETAPSVRVQCEDGCSTRLAALGGIGGFEAILVDLQRPDLGLQSGSGNTEPRSRARGSVYLSSAFRQRSLDNCLLLRRKLLKKTMSPTGLS